VVIISFLTYDYSIFTSLKFLSKIVNIFSSYITQESDCTWLRILLLFWGFLVLSENHTMEADFSEALIRTAGGKL
jgi:hypothetical protein